MIITFFLWIRKYSWYTIEYLGFLIFARVNNAVMSMPRDTIWSHYFSLSLFLYKWLSKKTTIGWCNPICLFFLWFPCLRSYISKNIARTTSEILLPMFSSRFFMVSCLTFKSLILLEFILKRGIRSWSSFIFLHTSDQYFQHH